MKKIQWIGPHLAEILLFLFGVGLMVFALYIVGPWFLSYVGTVSPISVGVAQRSAQIVIGLFFLFSSGVNVSIPIFRKTSKRLTVTKLAAILSFISFSFLAFLRILVFGWLPLTWIYPVMLALACGVIRVYLELRAK